MSAAFWTDVRSLLRNIRFIAGAPRVILYAIRDTPECLAAYDQVVLPIINDYVREAATKRWLIESLKSYSATACWVIRAYTRMADLVFVAELAVLGASFNRLYDDLFDELEHDGALGERLSELFRFGTFEPVNDAEQVLHELFGAIKQLLDRPPSDPIFDVAAAVHEYQVRSIGQHNAAAGPQVLLEVTQGKGGYAVVAMFALMRPAMQAEESDLLFRLGEIIQLLDDYQDHDLDAENDVRTLATEGLLSLSNVTDLLRRAYPDFCRFYGRKSAARFWACLYIAMSISCLAHHFPRCRVTSYPETKETAWALKMLLAPDSGSLRSASDATASYHNLVIKNDTQHEL